MMKKYMRYGAAINLSGLYAPEPVGLTYFPDLDDWYDETNNFSVPHLGIIERDGLITFSSINKSEVKRWIDGAKAALSLLKNWATVEKK